MPKDLGVELSRLIEMQVLEKAFTDANAKMAAMLGTRWAGMATDFMAIKAHCECAGRLRAATAACARDVDGGRDRELLGEPTVGHARR